MMGWTLRSSSSIGLCLICTMLRHASVVVWRSVAAGLTRGATTVAGTDWAIAVMFSPQRASGGVSCRRLFGLGVLLSRAAGQREEGLVETGLAQRQLRRDPPEVVE